MVVGSDKASGAASELFVVEDHASAEQSVRIKYVLPPISVKLLRMRESKNPTVVSPSENGLISPISCENETQEFKRPSSLVCTE